MTQDLKKIIKWSSVAAFTLLIVLYAIFRSSGLLWGVKIKNVSLTRDEGIVKIAGNAKNATNLYLNGRGISIDEIGNFSETIALLPGYNIVSLNARDKFNNEDEKIYQLIF